MKFLEKLNHDLDEYHLLKHPFYESWNAGQLSKSTLQTYAREYYHHVAAFPQYISAIHSQCNNLATRQVLLGNLIEEEQGEENHPELWTRFAEGLGCSRKEVKSSPQLKSTTALVDGYFDLVRSDFAKGLGALYAYERQTPDVATSKIEGLEKHYGVTDSKSLQFFKVHVEADQWHSEECAKLIEGLTPSQKEQAYQGAMKGARLLWQFLDEMAEINGCGNKHECCVN